MFTVKGIINGKTLSLKWHDGKLTGDEEAVTKALEENKKEYGWLGLGAEVVNKNYINDSYPAHHLIVKYVFEKVLEETNDFPPFDPNVIY